MFKRPGKLADYMPRPYPNDEAARAGNAGALPPDLSLMVKARHGGADYIMALVTGYVDPPPGIHVAGTMNYNPYFPGGQIGMARVLFDGLVEFEDGTPATTTQVSLLNCGTSCHQTKWLSFVMAFADGQGRRDFPQYSRILLACLAEMCLTFHTFQ